VTNRFRRPARWSVRATAALLAVTIVVPIAPAVGVALAADPVPATALVIDGDPGDFIGQGLYETLLPPDHTFQSGGHTATTVYVSVSDGGSWWSWFFTAPTGQTIVPGTYQTGSLPSATDATVSFSGHSSGCQQTGTTTIHEYAFDAGSDTLTSLAATFALKCNNTWVYGDLRWNSTVPWATAAATPTSLDFGTDPIGGPAVSRTVAVESTGSGPLHVSGLTVDGAGGSDYAITNDECTGVALDPGSTCDVTLAFNAHGLPMEQGALHVQSDTARASLAIPLSATAATSWRSDPDYLDFGTVSVLAPATKRITLHYDGDGSLAISGFSFQPTWLGDPTDFSVAAETCTAAPIPSGSSCTVDVRLAPTAQMQEEGVLAMTGPPPLDANGTYLVVVHGYGGPYAPAVAWSNPAVVTPSYTWNDGGALGRTTVSAATGYFHLLSMTDRVGGKWVTNSGPYLGVMYTRSSTGTTWTAAKRLNPSTRHGYWGTLAATGKDVDVAWVQSAKVYNVSSTAPRVLYFRHNGNHGASASWATTKRLTSLTGRIDHPSIAAYGARILVAWTNSATGSVNVALSKDHGSTFTTVSVGTTSRNTALGKSGQPVVAMYGSTAIVSWIATVGGAIKARISTNYGSAWHTTSTVSSANSITPTVTAASGRAAVAFSDGLSIYMRVWKSGWGPHLAINPDLSGAYQKQYAPAVTMHGATGIGLSWAGCHTQNIVDCQEASSATTVNLLWSESPDNGAHWSMGSVIASDFEAPTRRINEVPSVYWGSKRYVVWNGGTAGTNYYRLYTLSGTTTAAAAALVAATKVSSPAPAPAEGLPSCDPTGAGFTIDSLARPPGSGIGDC
jgi:hypothetical protein